MVGQYHLAAMETEYFMGEPAKITYLGRERVVGSGEGGGGGGAGD